MSAIPETKRECPTCGEVRHRGRWFPNLAGECYWCRISLEGRLCPGCNEAKPLTAFRVVGSTCSGMDKYHLCRPCDTDARRVWTDANPEKVKDAKRKHRTGVDGATFREALARTPSCPICLREWTDGFVPHADHDHATGEFRGLLCGSCNRTLGLMGDDVLRLRRAADYLLGAL